MFPYNRKPNFNNRPKHLKIDENYYFFTVSTINGQWFLRPDKYKQILLDKIIEKTKKYNNALLAYVILSNHYHIIIKILQSKNISKMIGEINGSSSKAINEIDGVINRKIWWNYYDHIIRDETDFYKHLNYIHQNPIKHGVTNDFDYKFSSYRVWIIKRGKEYLDDALEKYPIIDFMVNKDEY